MICNKCGATIPDDSLFCENCGAPLEVEGAVDEPVEEVYEEPAEELYDEPVEEVCDEPAEETYEELVDEPVEEVYDEPVEDADDELYEGSEEAYEEPEEVYEEEEYVAEEELNYEVDEEPEEMPIEDVAESEDFSEIEELEAMEVEEEPEFYDEAEEVEDDEFREIDELESMEEVEYDEEEYEYEDDYEDYDQEIDEDQITVGELPEEAELPALSELEFEETGQPEGAETEWLESFQQLEPKAEDWDRPIEEEVLEEPVEEEFVEEEVLEEPVEEEYIEEEIIEEPAEDEFVEEEVFEDPGEEEFIEEAVMEEPADEEVLEEEAIEEELPDRAAEEPEFTEEPEEAEEPEFTEEPEEAEEFELTEEPEAFEEPELTEEPEAAEESKMAEEPETIEEPEAHEPSEETEAPEGPDTGEKIGAWLGNLGKSVRTGTGWAVDIAKDKATKLKEDKKAENSQKKPDRNQWAEEDEGELDLGYNFWYRSNQADTSSRYEGMEEEEEPELEGAEKGSEKEAKEEPKMRSRIDDATTYVAVKSMPDEKKEIDEEGEASEDKDPTKKKPNKLKITVIIMVIAAILGAGGIFGSKAYTENKQEEAYNASLTKAEQSMESKDYATAEKTYKALIKEYPDRAELYEALAKVYIADEKFDDARNTVNEGIARTGKSKAFATLLADIDALTSTDWQEPFRRVLADNEWAARSYEDENGSCVALCDITGDRKPEMIYFTQEYYGYGILHLCVYENEKVTEVSYECKNRGTQYQDAFYDIEDDDSGYVVYKSKTDGKFGIYESVRRGYEAWQTINKYTLSGTDCDRDEVIEACIETSYQVSDDDADDVSKNDYYKNEKKIKYNAYLDEFKAVLDDIDKVIITSENPAGDKEIWNRIMDMDEEAMTYDGAMKILDEDAQ